LPNAVTVRTRAQNAHRKSIEAELHDVAFYLQEALGQKLTAHLAGVTDPRQVGAWGRQEHNPRSESARRLRAAYQIYQLILAEESPYVARAWFAGLNPRLDDEAPADAIRDDHLKEALAAAKAYVRGG
jgi:hypothetical protein